MSVNRRIVLKDLIKKFYDYEDTGFTDNQSWWEGYTCGLAEAGVIIISTEDAFIRFVQKHVVITK